MSIKEIKKESKKLLETNIMSILKIFSIYFLLTLVLTLIIEFLNLGGVLYNLLNLIVTFLLAPLYVAVVKRSLDIVRNKETKSSIFEFYKSSISIFVAILIFSFLFEVAYSFYVIPGIIFYLFYAFYNYTIADGCNNILLIFRKSRELIEGHKKDYFLFLLSFIGWFILSIFTMGIALIYVAPYFLLSNALFYDKLKNNKKYS